MFKTYGHTSHYNRRGAQGKRGAQPRARRPAPPTGPRATHVGGPCHHIRRDRMVASLHFSGAGEACHRFAVSTRRKGRTTLHALSEDRAEQRRHASSTEPLAGLASATGLLGALAR